MYIGGRLVYRPYYYCNESLIVGAGVPLPPFVVGVQIGPRYPVVAGGYDARSYYGRSYDDRYDRRYDDEYDGRYDHRGDYNRHRCDRGSRDDDAYYDDDYDRD